MLLCYGAHDDAALLSQYGFVPKRNAHRRCVLLDAATTHVDALDETTADETTADDTTAEGHAAGPNLTGGAASADANAADGTRLKADETAAGVDKEVESTAATGERSDSALRGVSDAGVSVGVVGGLSASKAAWLIENGFEDEHWLTSQGASWNLMAALRLKHASQEEIDLGAAMAILEGEAASACGEAAALRALRKLATQRLAGYSRLSTLEDDQADLLALEAQGVQGVQGVPCESVACGRRRLALEWRVAQKTLLVECLAAVDLAIAEQCVTDREGPRRLQSVRDREAAQSKRAKTGR